MKLFVSNSSPRVYAGAVVALQISSILFLTSCGGGGETSSTEITPPPNSAEYEKTGDFTPGIMEFYTANKSEFDKSMGKVQHMLDIANDSAQYTAALNKSDFKSITLDLKEETRNVAFFILEGMKDTAAFTYKPLYSVADYVDDCYMLSKFGLSYMTANLPSKNHYREFFHRGLDDFKLKPYLIILKRLEESEFSYYGDSFKSGALAFRFCVFETATEKLLTTQVCQVENQDLIFYHVGDNIPDKITQDLKQQIPRMIYSQLFKSFTINGNGNNVYVDFIGRY